MNVPVWLSRGEDSLETKPEEERKRSRPNLVQRTILLFAIAFIALAICGALIAYRQNQQQRRHKTESVAARIIDIYERRGSNSTGKASEVDDVIVDYEYTVGGRVYRDNVRLSASTGRLFEKGQDAKVCYEPGRPGNAELFASDYVCGN
jgi:preprotein translocase subunit SecG